MNVGSLFSGIGGFDLAARWVGWETKWYSEIDPYACRVMQEHFPRAYNVGDVTTWEPVADAGLPEPQGRDCGASERTPRQTGEHPPRQESTPRNQQAGPLPDHTVDLICGGFPCQPVSVAGKQLAQDDPRWLWPHFARVIRALRPRHVVVENVPGLLVRGGLDVLGDFAAIGLTAEWETISAAAVGAPHRRDRVWIVAYRAEHRGLLAHAGERGRGVEEQEIRPGWDAARDGGQDVADAVRTGQEHAGPGDARRECESRRNTAARGGRWDAEPNVGRVAHGVPSRVDRLKCLGNSIVPQVAYFIFQQIQEYEMRQAA